MFLYKDSIEMVFFMANEPQILGIDVGGTSVKMGLLDQNGGVAGVRQIDMVPGEPELMAGRMSELALEYDFDIIGVGTAGAVNHKTGLVSAGNLYWNNVPLRAMLEEAIGKPVWVDNDAQSALMAEWHSGVIKGANCAVFVTLGTGLGGGLLIDGRPWRGEDNTAFELGHIVTHGGVYRKDGSTKEGRFEHYASGMGLSRMAGGRPAREVVMGVLANDAESLRIFDWFIHELGLGLLTVNTLFKPEIIALGGGISAAGEYLLEGIRNKMSELYGGRSRSAQPAIHLAIHQNNAGMIGAAALAKLYLVK